MSAINPDQPIPENITTGIEYWPVEHVKESRINAVDFEHLKFGSVYSDHMLVANYEDGAWRDVVIKPFGDLSLSPANATLHYSQTIFEGIKAYKDQQGNITIFRPEKNCERMQRSAERMSMPPIPYEIFMEGMLQLVKLDQDWIPTKEGSSLYIRPFYFASENFLGVRPATKYMFLIITSPSGPYYDKTLKLYIEDYYVRAAEGGVGAAKTGANYAASLYPTEKRHEQGYDQILWTDAKEHKYLQECGTMNLFVVIDGVALTPTLKQDSVLSGVTRDSVIELLKERGIPVEERLISVDELLEAGHKGTLQEVFGTGTAAKISFIESLQYKDQFIPLSPKEEWEVAPFLLKELNDIQHGRTADNHNWVVKL